RCARARLGPAHLVGPTHDFEPTVEMLDDDAAALDPIAAIRIANAAAPLVRRLIAAHPHVPARLLIGNETISDNPKLNNVYKGWRAAAYDWIVMAESNVLMPRDYIELLRAAWRADTGVVSSPPAGCRPQGFWAELECAFLNTYQLRWQYAAAAIGLDFAQG